MTKMMSASTALAALVIAMLYGSPAEALNVKSFVANTGNDGFTCVDVPNACKTFSSALSKTIAGGEITVINAGDYGTVSIAKAINISNDSAGEAGILNPGGVSMFISAGVGDVVSLRGLVFEGAVSGTVGILFMNGSALHIQNCVMRNYEGGGVGGLYFAPGGNSQLFVSDTILFNNGSGANSGGIVVQPQATGSANVVLDRVRLENNVVGLRLDAATLASGGNGIHALMRDSVASGNAADGISVFTQSGKPSAFLFVERSSTVNNAGNGISANGLHAIAVVSDSTITRNGTGVSAVNSGQVISYSNNRNNNNVGAEGTATSFFSLF